MQGAVEDLSEADLHLEDRELVAVAGTAIGTGEGVGQAGEPAPEEGIDVIGPKAVADLLEQLRIVAVEEAVVEGGVGDASAVHLAFRPLVAVDPDTHAEWDVGGELDETQAEVSVKDVEIVLVDVDGAAVEIEPGGALRAHAAAAAGSAAQGAEGGDLLLGYANEDDPLGGFEVGEPLLSSFLFVLSALEADEGDPLSLSEGVDGGDEGIGHLLEKRRGHDGLAAVAFEEPAELVRALEPRDVAVEIKPVDAIEVECDVVAQ